MSWSELDSQSPQVARLGKRLLQSSAVAFLATVRPDGAPRVHPVCPVLWNGDLFVGLIDRTPKARDLRRDPRCVLHALPGPGDCEFWVEAVAEPVSEAVALRHAIENPRLKLPPGDTLFRLELRAAHATLFQPGEGNRPVPSRRHWRAAGNLTAAAERASA
jgi:hypothetical protein